MQDQSLVSTYLRAFGVEPVGGFLSKAARIESQGGEFWAKHFFPHLFTRPFTVYQQKFWEWGWQIEAGQYYRPRVECQPRGVGKSSNAEALAAALIARRKRQMIGYVGLDDDKATRHFDSIKMMLESNEFISVYPHCRPQVQKLRNVAAQWSRDALVTESGAMIVPLSLQGSSRGWKSPVGARFDLIFLDDVDQLGMSVNLIRKFLELLKGEILAAGDDNTLVIMPQNLIHRDSICSQILDHRADILSDREFQGPYPLLKWYTAEKRDLADGARRWVITGGEAFDPAIDVAYAEKLLNKFGKATFDHECQQRVFEVGEDKDFREWSEVYHVITESEFLRTMHAYGEAVWNFERQTLQIPARWNVGIGFDWGSTLKHPAAIAFVARPSEVSPLRDCHFVFGEVVRPKFPVDIQQETEAVSPGRVAEAINQFLRHWNVSESQIKIKLMSHEASATLNTMAIDLREDIKQFFNKWKAQKGSGVPQIQNLLEINRQKPHPFRTFPKGYVKNGQNLEGQRLPGSPRLFFIVADGQGELRVDLNGELYVTGAIDSRGLARARFELPLYNHRLQGAQKIDDDFTDGFRGLMAQFGVMADPQTTEEKVAETLEIIVPAGYLKQVVETAPERYGSAFMGRRAMENNIRRELEEEERPTPYGSEIG